MDRLLIARAAISSELTSGMPPDEQRRQRARDLRRREACRASGPKYGRRSIERVEPAPLLRLPEPQHAPRNGRDEPRDDEPGAADEIRRDGDDDPRRQRQFGAVPEVLVELRELRHDLEDDERDDDRCESRTSTTG